MEKLLEKINALARKSRTEGLTDSEKEEQQKLRQAYLKLFRQNMEKTLENVYILDENGNEKKIEKKR